MSRIVGNLKVPIETGTLTENVLILRDQVDMIEDVINKIRIWVTCRNKNGMELRRLTEQR